MAAIKGAAIEQFVARPDLKISAVLIYGADAGQIRDHAQALVKSVTGSLDNAFSVARLDEARLAGDPGLLIDEFQAQSLFGGRRAIWVQDAGAAFLRAIEPIIARPGEGNLVIAEAGSLPKTSKLRSLFEASRHAIAAACYEDTARDTARLIDTELRQAGLAIEPDASDHLASLLGSDRALARRDIEKLATYCFGRSSVTMADVEAVCGDSSGASLDSLVDAVFGGDLDETDNAFAALIDSGTAANSILLAAGRHLAQLERLALEAARRGVDAAVKSARPPIFYKRQDAIIRHLKTWDTGSLRAAGAALGAAQLQGRLEPALEDAIAARTFFSLARKARALRTA